MKFRLLFVFLVLLFGLCNIFLLSGQINPETKEIYIHSLQREVVPLNGIWEASFDEVTWFPIKLPNTFYNRDKIFFRKVIKLSEQLQGDHYWHLYFLGVSEEIEVSWNGQILGHFVSENTPIFVTIPKRLGVHSENELRLTVYSSYSLSRLIKGKYHFNAKIITGISREFFLVRTSPIWISSINSLFKWSESIRGELNLQILVNSFSLEGIFSRQTQNQISSKGLFTCEIQVIGKQDKQVIATGSIDFEIGSFRSIKLNIDLPIVNFKYWDIENPYLYEIVAKITRSGVIYDDYTKDLGFRRVEFKKTNLGSSIFFNGKPFVFKGVNLIEDFDYYNSGLTLAKIEQDIILLKSLGVNTVRFIQIPPNPAFLYYCNKYGLLVLIDLPLYYVPKELLLENDLFVRYQTIGENILKEFTAMPAFLGLGLSEGLQEGTEEIDNFYQGLLQKLKLFGDILIYKTIVLNSRNYSFSDFNFLILKDNWKFKSIGEISTQIREHLSYCTIPLAFDFGIVINPNNRNGYNDKLSIEYQAQFILQRFNLSQKHQLAGDFIWTFNDYFLENPLLQVANVEPYGCYSGLVNNVRQPRFSFYVVRALFNNEDPPIINPGIMEATFPYTYVIIGILISLIVGAMIYRSRRFREHVFRSFFHSYNFFADIRDRRIISNVQTFILILSLGLIVGGYVSSFVDFYKNMEEFRYFILLLVPNLFLREWLFRLVWSPEISTIVFGVLFCILLLLIMLILKLFAVLLQRKVYFHDIFKMTVWSCLPILLLLPFTVFASRIFLMSEFFSYVFNLGFLIVLLWSGSRIIRSVWIVFDILKRRVYIATLIFVLLIIIFLLTYYEYNYKIIEYSNFFVQQIL